MAFKLNKPETVETIKASLTPEEHPIAFENRVKDLLPAGYSRKEAEKMAREPMEMEIYFEVGTSLFAVDSGAIENGAFVYSPYTQEQGQDDED